MNFVNKKMKSAVYSLTMLLVVLVVSPLNLKASSEDPEKPAFAFSDEQLLNFFDANQQMSAIQRETNEKMAEAADAGGLTLERFNQISRANQIGALQGGTFTDAEIEAFNQVGPKITAIQREQIARNQELLESKDFTTASYQEILNAYRTDSDLQSHVRDLLRERRRQEILEERRREAEAAQQG